MTTSARRLLLEWGPLVSRGCLALVFVASGFFKLAHPSETSAVVVARGLPASQALAIAAGCFELSLGLLLLIGFRARWCAAILLVFLLPVTVLFHNPAGLAPVDAQLQATMIMKNLAIAGGLLGILVHGAGPLSLDSARIAHAPGKDLRTPTVSTRLRSSRDVSHPRD